MGQNISSGELRKKVVFKQPVSSLNNEGGQERTYTTAFTTWARVDRFNQYRATEASVTSLIGALDFYIRWAEDREDVNKDWLIEYGGNDYVIHVIEPIEQKQKFLRFTAKSKGTAVVSTNSESSGDYPVSEGDTGETDMSHLKFSFSSTTGVEVVLSILKNTLIDESFVDWGDGDTDVIAAGASIATSHVYAAGDFDCKVYPINGLVTPTAQAVNLIESINVIVSGGVDPTDATMTVGNSLSACDFLKFFEAQDWGMTTFPNLPDAGLEQVRTVNIPGSNLSGAECSQILVQCDAIGWPVGYIDLTDSPGICSLSTAGTAALASLQAKGWALYPWYP